VARGLKYDLLSVRGLIYAGYAGYAAHHHAKPRRIWNMCFDSSLTGPTNLNIFHSKVSTRIFYLKLEQMCARQLAKQYGYELSHRRLAHALNRIIRDMIECTIGFESLKRMTFKTHVKCPSCMIGKATPVVEDFPKAKRLINKPLYQVHMNFYTTSSPVKSIEGYIHAIVFIDAATGYRWIYDMKTKDDAIHLLKRWTATSLI
jgi:hypothetical protein